MKRLQSALLFLCLFVLTGILPSTPCLAHPHVFVESQVTFVFNADGLAGFWEEWTLDEIFSAFLFEDFDTNCDKTFDAQELQALKEGAFDTLGEYNYFTHILMGRKRFPVRQASDFSAIPSENQITYRFFVPFPVKSTQEPIQLTISIFDETYYTDVDFHTDSIGYEGREFVETSEQTREIEELVYYYEQVIPKGVELSFKLPAGNTMSEEDLSMPEPGEPAPSAGTGTPEKSLTQPGAREAASSHALLNRIFAWQKALRVTMTRFGKEVRDDPYGVSFWLLLAFSFAYGVIHALGPGHGKMLVSSYFLSRPGTYWHGLCMAHLSMFLHVFSAVALILGLRLILETTGMASFDSASQSLQSLSYSLLILLGLFLLGKAMHDLKTGPPQNTKHKPARETADIKSLVLMSVATGIVPCPGAAMILIFSMTLNILVPGLLAMASMAMGMGLTTSIFALLAISSRSAMLQAGAGKRRLHFFIHSLLSITGAIAIIALGSLLLAA